MASLRLQINDAVLYEGSAIAVPRVGETLLGGQPYTF
jgi:hypothetical protein